MMRRSVVFPEPLAPMTHRNSPVPISNETSASTRVEPPLGVG